MGDFASGGQEGVALLHLPPEGQAPLWTPADCPGGAFGAWDNEDAAGWREEGGVLMTIFSALGAGKMANAILSGAVASGYLTPDQVGTYNVHEEKRRAMGEKG